MKKTKIIIPALGLLVLSTAASVSGTVAWFSVNSSVSATGMKVLAKAEAGLLISADKSNTSWADTDASDYGTAVALVPTSTNNLSTWYHAVSSSVNNHAHNGAYSTLGTTSGENVIVVKQANLATTTNAEAYVTYADSNSDDAYAAANDTAYYLRNRFWLKSSGDQITVTGTSNYLVISKITLSGLDETANLDASLRIGVLIGSSVKIIAPFADATASYTVAGTTATTAILGTLGTNGNYNPDVNTGFASTIPAMTTDSPLAVDIFLWFEGEDENCKSINLAAEMDELEVAVEFSLTSTAPAH